MNIDSDVNICPADGDNLTSPPRKRKKNKKKLCIKIFQLTSLQDKVLVGSAFIPILF